MTVAAVSEPSPIKLRRTRAEMAVVRAAIMAVLAVDHPMTVRQVFYQLVGRGAIAKSETEYKGTVVRLLSELRRAGELPYDWIADNTRWMRKPRTFSSLLQALEHTAAFYRRSVWAEADAYVEVWLEKDALAGVLLDVTSEYDVLLMVTRGYPSLTYLHSAAEAIAAAGKPAYLYYFGDYDPSGVHIPQKVEQDLRLFAPRAEIHFERVAVTPAQIRDLRLPTRPTKLSDSRSKGFGGESVEVDAIPPAQLRALARQRIEQHVDQRRLAALELAEESERQILRTYADDAWQRSGE